MQSQNFQMLAALTVVTAIQSFSNEETAIYKYTDLGA
jgi:hypothetical protein